MIHNRNRLCVRARLGDTGTDVRGPFLISDLLSALRRAGHADAELVRVDESPTLTASLRVGGKPFVVSAAPFDVDQGDTQEEVDAWWSVKLDDASRNGVVRLNARKVVDAPSYVWQVGRAGGEAQKVAVADALYLVWASMADAASWEAVQQDYLCRATYEEVAYLEPKVFVDAVTMLLASSSS